MAKDITERLRAAFGRFQAQDLPGAERLIGEILREAPGEPNALHLLGVMRLAGGNARESASLITRALGAHPQDAAMLENLGLAHATLGDYGAAESAFRRALAQGAPHGLLYMRLGLTLASQGRLPEAVAALREAAARSPADPDVLLNLGNALAGQGHAEEALACYQKLLALHPGHAIVHFNLGNLYENMGRLEEAAAAFTRALALAPNDADTHNNLGLVYDRQQRHDDAAASYRRALALNPGHVQARNNLGNVLRTQGRLEEAVACYERALAEAPGHLDGYVNLGIARAEQERYTEAQGLFEKALRLNPFSFEAHSNLGRLLRQQGAPAAAAGHNRQAIELNPRSAMAHSELGQSRRDLGDMDAAIACFHRVVELEPGSAGAWYDLAETLKVAGRFDDAIEAYSRALALKPDYHRALGGLAYMRQHVCDWDGIEGLWERLGAEAIGKAGSGVSPFSILYMPFSAQDQLACAREWARQTLGPLTAARTALGFGDLRRAPRPRMRIGYLSWDFHQHATAYLIAELFELHDRTRFEIFTYSYGPDDGSSIRSRIRAASENFIDVGGEPFAETAQRIRRDGIDILVDLKGYTLNSRSRILALRPAPVQVNWLGYPGSMGSDCVDYILADPFIIPDGAERHYSEKVVRLPDCYQVNDRKREISSLTPTRQECGLPAGGVVFCSFNQSAKILPDVFAVWMRTLTATPGSVLWLLENHRRASDNLRRSVAQHGVAPERLIFAGRKPMPEHLGRYRLADLALDTFPYTSHTTGSDALWAGCPLVTCAGSTFASRVAGSLLINAGLSELITRDLGEYERRILELANDPDELRELRGRLQGYRDSCALFDTPRFVRNLEAAYDRMLADARDGRTA